MLADPAAHRVNPTDNPYGDGRAADRIVAALEYLAGIAPAPARYGPGFSRKVVLEAAGYPYGLLSAPASRGERSPTVTRRHDRWVGH